MQQEVPHDSPHYLPIATGTFRVRDGRWLQWSEYGRANGVPILTFHGAPGSRGEASMYGPAAHHFGARVIAISRPGFGHSTPHPGRTLRDFIDDSREVLDAKQVERFAVTGYSAGGPYALATAALMPDRVSAVNLIAPVAPPAMTRMLPGPGLPFLLGQSFKAQLAKRIPGAHRQLQRLAARPVRDLGLPDVSGAAFLDSVRAAFTHGPHTVLHDWRLTFGTWDFDIGDLGDRTIDIWQGKRDLSVSWRATSNMARCLPGARVHLDSRTNHFSVFTMHADEAIAALVASLQEPISPVSANTSRS